DSASVQKLAAYLKTLPADASPPAKQDVNPANGGSTLFVGSFDTGIPLSETVTRTLAGIGKGMSDLGSGVKERFQQAFSSPTMSSLITGERPEDAIAETRRLEAPLMATTAGKVGNVAGKVATALPTVFIPGANTLVG